MIERVLVVGATGMLGAPVAAALRRRGLVVRALVRDAEKARRVLGDGYELARGDVMDGDALQRALDGCQAVHVSLSGAWTRGRSSASSITGRPTSRWPRRARVYGI